MSLAASANNMPSEPSAAHSSGASTSTGGLHQPVGSDGDSTAAPQMAASANMQVDSNMTQSYSARMQSMDYSSHQLVDKEVSYRAELNSRLHASQQTPFVPDIDPELQKAEFSKGTYDAATYSLIQSRDDYPILRHDMINPPLNQHAFKDAVAKGLNCPSEWLSSTQPAAIKDVTDIMLSYYGFVARPELG